MREAHGKLFEMRVIRNCFTSLNFGSFRYFGFFGLVSNGAKCFSQMEVGNQSHKQ